MNKWYLWLSFADPMKPKGTQFLGCIIIDVLGDPDTYEGAKAMLRQGIEKTHRLKVNPGGEVHGTPMHPGLYDRLPKELVGVLMPLEWCEALDNHLMKEHETDRH